jgi:integrase
MLALAYSHAVSAEGGEETALDRIGGAFRSNRLEEKTVAAKRRRRSEFAGWLSRYGITPERVTAVVATRYMVYLAALRSNPLAPASLPGELYGMRELVREAGGEDFWDTPQFQETWHGIRKWLARPVERVHPVSAAELLLLLEECRRSSERVVLLRDGAMYSLGFHALLRPGELLGMRIEHVSFLADGSVRIWFSSTKGAKMRIARGAVHTGEAAIVAPVPELGDGCPVRALRLWLDELQRQGVVSGDCWRGQRHGVVALDSRGVSYTTFVSSLKRRAEAAGLDVRVGGHSFRRGGASQLAEAGVPIRWIEVAGRWARGSSSVSDYIDASARVHELIADAMWRPSATMAVARAAAAAAAADASSWGGH